MYQNIGGYIPAEINVICYMQINIKILLPMQATQNKVKILSMPNQWHVFILSHDLHTETLPDNKGHKQNNLYIKDIIHTSQHHIKM